VRDLERLGLFSQDCYNAQWACRLAVKLAEQASSQTKKLLDSAEKTFAPRPNKALETKLSIGVPICHTWKTIRSPQMCWPFERLLSLAYQSHRSEIREGYREENTREDHFIGRIVSI
jgi:hypothetical protein